jgi:predicted ATPase
VTARRAPLAPPDLAGVTHQPTRELIAALYEHGWQVVGDVVGGRAVLAHPDRPGDTIVTWFDGARIDRVFVNAQQKLISRTIEFIREG